MDKNAEATEEQVEKLDIDKALNTKGFAEFLASHPDADKFDMEDVEEVTKRFELFQAKNEISKEIKNLYSGHIQKEMGIKLGADDLASIDAHLEKQAIENPEELTKTKESLDLFKELPEQIKLMEGQLAQLAKADDLERNLTTLKTDRDLLVQASLNMGMVNKGKLVFESLKHWFNDTGESPEGKVASLKWDVLKSAKQRFGKIDRQEARYIYFELDDQIKEVEKTLEGVRDAEQLRSIAEKMLGEARKNLLGGIGEISQLTDAIQEKVETQLQALLDTGTIKNLDKAQERLDALRKVAESTETGVDPFDGSEADWRDQIETSVVTRATEEIAQAVHGAPMGENAFTKLEKSLEPFLNKE